MASVLAPCVKKDCRRDLVHGACFAEQLPAEGDARLNEQPGSASPLSPIWEALEVVKGIATIRAPLGFITHKAEAP